MAVLIDSSVWIAGASSKNKECLALRRMIHGNELIYVARPIQVEVCQGARSDEEFHKLWDGFLGFEFLDITDRVWGVSAWNYLKCRQKGITLTTLDCLIATLSKEYRIPLWTLDRAFTKARPLIGFETFKS